MGKGFCHNPNYYKEIKLRKNFLIINIDLLEKLDELTPSARKIYIKLYSLSEKCRNYTKNEFPDLDIRASVLVKQIGIDRTTVVRGLNELHKEGWILKEQKDFHTYKITVGAPEHHLKDIIENTPDRKSTHTKSDIVQKLDTRPCNNEEVIKPKDEIEVNDNHIIEKKDDAVLQQKGNEVYKSYISKIKELTSQGTSRLKAPIEAMKLFSKEEQDIIKSVIKSDMSYSRKPTSNFSSPSLCKDSSKLMHSRKPITIYKNNIFTVNSKTDANKSHGQNTDLKSEKVSKVTKINFDYVYCYLKKLSKQGDIPRQLMRSKSLDEIAYEIYFHVQNRDLNKTKSDFHALNAAVLLLKAGKWSTPFELKRQRSNESKQREISAMQYKDKELSDLKSSAVSKLLMS